MPKKVDIYSLTYYDGLLSKKSIEAQKPCDFYSDFTFNDLTDLAYTSSFTEEEQTYSILLISNFTFNDFANNLFYSDFTFNDTFVVPYLISDFENN